jgi:hypothetical protein
MICWTMLNVFTLNTEKSFVRKISVVIGSFFSCFCYLVMRIWVRMDLYHFVGLDQRLWLMNLSSQKDADPNNASSHLCLNKTPQKMAWFQNRDLRILCVALQRNTVLISVFFSFMKSMILILFN